MNTYWGEETLGKIIPIKRNYQFNLGFFFFFQMQMVIFLLSYLSTFSGQLYYWRSYFFTLLNYFDKTVALLEHLFIRPVAFFKELRFRKSYFLATVIFSEYLIFRNQTSTKQSLCENRKFFRVVTFWNSYFFGGLIA